MTNAKLQYNERAWAIDLISHINGFLPKANLSIKRASGENTLKTGKGLFFPDVLLYADQTSGKVLQGWELKMPNTPIDDRDLIDNAKKKARALGLNSFVVWNASEAHLYIANDSGEYIANSEPLYHNPSIKIRDDVSNRPDLWKSAAYDILSKIDRFFAGGKIAGVSPDALFAGEGFVGQLLSCHAEVKAFIDQTCQKDNNVEAKINVWWRLVEHEYPGENFPASPLAYLVLLRWFNRFIFSNILKAYTSAADRVNRIQQGTTIQDALKIFSEVAAEGNFSNIFSRDEFDCLLPDDVWETLVGFNAFLSDFDFSRIDKNVLQSILRSAVLSTIKKSAGLYITPDPVAHLLVRLSLSNKSGTAIDPFCGTGTIVNAILAAKADSNITGSEATQQTWGSDKFAFPVQIATIAVSTPETMGEILRIFTHDAFELFTGKNIEFIDPSTGEPKTIALPKFSAIISNLPFVRFEDIETLNPSAKVKIDGFYSQYNIPERERLDGRSDLFSYIPFMLYDLLEDNGFLGIIVSNSWLPSAGWGEKFRALLNRFYSIKYVVTSANGRWFQNADVVTNLLICQKKNPVSISEDISFVSTLCNLDECDGDDIKSIADDILANPCSENVTISTLSCNELNQLREMNIGWNFCFAGIQWLVSNKEKYISVRNYAHIARGERRGWNAMFYPSSNDNNAIEPEYLKPVLKNLRGVKTLLVSPNDKAFCCSVPFEELSSLGKTGAAQWIKRFENSKNGSGRPLPEVLERTNLFWYQMDATTLADFVISMNPDSRLFVAKTKEPTFVDQRLIRFTVIDPEQNTELLHALLNSIYSICLIEAIGFGRGLGVLDINATKIREGLYTPNMELISEPKAVQILDLFESIKSRNVRPILDELNEPSRIEFDKAITKAIGLAETDMQNAYNGLRTMYKNRKSVGR